MTAVRAEALGPAFDVGAYGIDSRWRDRAPAARRLLVAYAHPDDESFGNGGTIARYASRGVAVHYACGTRGEVGEVAPALLDGHADIAALRTAELTCAARELGLAAVHFLNHRDSGMPGSPDNDHPNALVRAPLDAVATQLVALIRAIRPQVVLTFNPYGGYGHPDHVRMHAATLAAFGAAGDAGRLPTPGLAPWSPARLYFGTFGTSLFRFLVAGLRIRGRDPRRFGQNNDIDLLKIIERATRVTTRLDNRPWLDHKRRASECHRSQYGGTTPIQRLPAPLRRRFLGFEGFTRVVPPWEGGATPETDLFDGIAG